MRPKGKAYKNVRNEKRWELIGESHHLVSIPVSNYIRGMEKQLKKVNTMPYITEPESIWGKIYSWLWRKANYFWYNLK